MSFSSKNEVHHQQYRLFFSSTWISQMSLGRNIRKHTQGRLETYQQPFKFIIRCSSLKEFQILGCAHSFLASTAPLQRRWRQQWVSCWDPSAYPQPPQSSQNVNSVNPTSLLSPPFSSSSLTISPLLLSHSQQSLLKPSPQLSLPHNRRTNKKSKSNNWSSTCTWGPI